MDTTNATNTTQSTDAVDTTKYSLIAGVFRERADADQGIEALKQAGMSEENIHLSVYDPSNGAEETDVDSSPGSSERRFIVQVQAEGREQEAVGLLTSHGANNSDLPPGTTLVHGTIVPTGGSKTENAASVTAGSSADSFFDSVKPASHPNDVRISDDTNTPGI